MKTLNIFRLISLSIVCVFGSTSCDDFLDLTPQTSLNTDSFFRTPDDMKSACNIFYSGASNTITSALPGHLYNIDLWSDDAYATSPNNISSASRIATGSDATWNNYFKLIYQANNILESISTVTGDAKEINRYLAEARFFRAWSYFELTRRYGNVPWINRTLNTNDPLVYGPRIDRKVVVDSILSDLDFAVEWLPKPSELAAADYGRVTKTAAWAFKSRVALFEGTRQKYFNEPDGNPTRLLTIAKDAAASVINSQEHALYKGSGSDSYRQLFLLTGNEKKVNEKIFVSLYGENSSNIIRSSTLSRSLEQAGMTPTQALIDAYLCTDGLPIEKTKTAYNEKDSVDAVFVYRDPRLSMTVFRKGDPFKGGDIAYNPPSGAGYTLTGYHQKKYYDVNAWTPNRNFQDLILIRYAEVLLNYAEAVYELNGNISDADLDLTVNNLRNRAGFPVKITNAFVTQNGLNMLDEIRRERRVELACEGFRYFDLIRWKKAEVELVKPVLARLFIADKTGQVHKVVQATSTRKFNANRDYLFPLPTLQIDLLRKDDTDPNKTWEQNPNW